MALLHWQHVHLGKADPMTPITIDDENAIRLVEELAALEGVSTTTVVIEAVQDRLDRKRLPAINEARMQYWLAFGSRVRTQMKPEDRDRDLTGDLYDENGLPR